MGLAREREGSNRLIVFLCFFPVFPFDWIECFLSVLSSLLAGTAVRTWSPVG
jgi:hypothetical protein